MRRRRFPGKTLLLLLGLAFALFYGMDMAHRGMERVQGPLTAYGANQPNGTDQGDAARQSSQPKGSGGLAGAEGAPGKGGAAQSGAAGGQAAGQKSVADTQNKPGQKASGKAGPEEAAPDVVVRESFVNHVSNRIGDALRLGAKAAIGLVVSIFDSIAR